MIISKLHDKENLLAIPTHLVINVDKHGEERNGSVDRQREGEIRSEEEEPQRYSAKTITISCTVTIEIDEGIRFVSFSWKSSKYAPKKGYKTINEVSKLLTHAAHVMIRT